MLNMFIKCIQLKIMSKHPSCDGHIRKLCKYDCDYCFERSFASSDKANFWYIGNESKAREHNKFSRERINFQCPDCNHIFCSKIYDMNRSSCAYCSKPPKKLCDNNNCDHCFKKSFASHEKSQFWSNKNDAKPRDLFLNSNSKYYFDCPDCDHSFSATLNHISDLKIGTWCPYCAGLKLCEDDKCDYCLERSFASHPKAIHWSKSNSSKARQIMKFTNKKYKFDCNKCNSIFPASCNHIASQNRWCPNCVNKTESFLYDWFSENLEYDTSRSYRPSWCKTKDGKLLFSFDIFIHNTNLIVELDGEQHFKPIKGWKSNPEEVQSRDFYKMTKALENGYTIIRLLQEDVYKNKNDWENSLKSAIRQYDEPQIIYLCKNGEYDEYSQNYLKYCAEQDGL